MNPALLFALAAAFVGGALVALQAPTNAMLSRAVGSPVNAALVSFAIGTVALIAVALALGVRPAAGEVKALPWHAWAGGLYGAFFVAVAAFAAPRLGVTFFLMVGIAGQLAMALLLDRMGALDRRDPPRPGRSLPGQAVTTESSPAFAGEGDHAKHGGGALLSQKNPSTALRAVPLPAKSRGGI